MGDRDLYIKAAQHFSPEKAGTDSMSVAKRVPGIVNGLQGIFAELMIPSDTAVTTILKGFEKGNDSWSGIRTVESATGEEEVVLSVFRLQTPAEDIFNALIPPEMVMHKALTLAARIRTKGDVHEVHGADILTELLAEPRQTHEPCEVQQETAPVNNYRNVMRLYGVHRVIGHNLLTDLHWLGLPHPQLVPDIDAPWIDPREVNPGLHTALDDFEAAIKRLAD